MAKPQKHMTECAKRRRKF